MLKVSEYATLIFDCDGVILDSNSIKTEAFYRSVLPYGRILASAMVDYHIEHQGVSRYKKFTYFLQQLAPEKINNNWESELGSLLKAYSDYVREGLMACEIAPNLAALRQKFSSSRWLIVSGGDQSELREIFSLRGIADLFDGGIFGSPDTKYEILQREITAGNILGPALFIGDSKLDFKAAVSADLDFLFLYGWSDVVDWGDWVKSNDINYDISLGSLVDER